jgi:hypothetical protein
MAAIAKQAKASVFQSIARALFRDDPSARPTERVEGKLIRRPKTAEREADLEPIARSPLIGGWMHMG